MYVAGAAEDVVRVTLFRVFVLTEDGRGVGGGALALAGASRYINAESHQSASIGAQQ
jgi:hypothetical protein